jgi:hypothetical protein
VLLCVSTPRRKNSYSGDGGSGGGGGVYVNLCVFVHMCTCPQSSVSMAILCIIGVLNTVSLDHMPPLQVNCLLDCS